MNNIFEFLDWCLKKRGNEPIDENTITGFMFNRWLSMSDNDVAKIVNVTHNRWGKIYDNHDFLQMARFYKTILPKITTRTTYLKKPPAKVEKENDDLAICQGMEISLREKKIYDRMLAEIVA